MLALADIKTRKTWALLDPEFARRLEWLMTFSKGRLGLGQGWRDPVQADALFVQRHYVSATGTISFQGKMWSLRAGFAPCAPADRSYHCPSTPDGRSLAADLVGDLNILHVSGTACGLLDFTYVGNEPWHCQPQEIPRSRGGYVASRDHPLAHFALPNEPTPAPPPAPPPPSEEDDVMEQIRVDGDPAVFLRNGLVVTWIQNELVQAALVADRILPSFTVKLVNRLSLKALELHGPCPATQTTPNDFAKWVP